MKKLLLVYDNMEACQRIKCSMSDCEIISYIPIEMATKDVLLFCKNITGTPVDYIVISAYNSKKRGLIKKLILNCFLLEQKKIMSDCIIDFYRVYRSFIKFPKVERLMKNPKYNDLEGLILGLSHAENGLVSSMFPYRTCNIAISCSDIYYNYKCLEYCYEHSKNNLRSLRYVIFDMYDYSYFNLDTSLGKNAFHYFFNHDGYIWDGHNFDDNKNFDFNFEQLKLMIDNDINGGISQLEKEHFLELFSNVFEYDNYDFFDDDYMVKGNNAVVTDDMIDGFNINSSLVTKQFLSTQQENLVMFEKIMELLYNINKDICVKILIMPRVYEIEQKFKVYDATLKEKFMEYLCYVRKRYNFEIIDLKDCETISKHHEFYYDTEHMNRMGAEYFTRYFIDNYMNDIIL